jgi:hypothetical protein
VNTQTAFLVSMKVDGGSTWIYEQLIRTRKMRTYANSAPPKKEATNSFQFMKVCKTSLTAGNEKALP